MDYCECITNSALGRSLLNFIREHTRQYCTGDECPVDGNPGNRGNRNDNNGPNMAVLGLIMILLLVSLMMSALTNKNRRRAIEDVANEKVRANSNNNDNDRNDQPPPSVN